MTGKRAVSYPQWALIAALLWLAYRIWLLQGAQAATEQETADLLTGVVGAAVVVLLALGYFAYTKRPQKGA